MGLDEILEKIEKDSEAKVEKIIEAAHSESKKIVDDAKRKGDERINSAKEKAEFESKAMIAREESRTRIEAAQRYQEALNAHINGAVDTVRKHLDEYRKSPDYKKLLNKLVERSVSDLGEGCTIYVNQSDVPLIRQSEQFHIAEPQDAFSGGIKAVSKDGTMSVDYTLEELLKGVSDKIAVGILKAIKKR